MWPLKYFFWLIPGQPTKMTNSDDIFFFRPYKKFVKFIKDTIMVSSDNDINICHRDNFLRLQSFVYFQFSAARFSYIIKFVRIFNSDYIEEFPGVFQTPLEYCFEKGLTEECFRENCDQPAFIKCAHCESCLYLDHAVIADLHILYL
ncbi:hypothetical protein C0J52_20493 [Blattella germanica]|nr:hypothetical protein C0J52_20493 [Blattella germanica]